MKRCAVLCLSPYLGGMELDSLKIATLLSDEHDVTYIFRKGTFIEKEANERSGKLELVPIHFHSKLSFRLAFALRKALKQNKIDNLIFFGASELGAIYLALLGLQMNLIVQHGTTKRRKKKSLYHKIIYSRVNYHVAVSRHISNNLKKILPRSSAVTKVICTSLDFANHKPVIKDRGGKIKLLQVGRLAPAKGQYEAIQACEALWEKGIDFEFTLVGNYDKVETLNSIKKLISEVAYKDKIKLVDFTKEIQTYYQESDIFLFPSHGEGMSNAILEALSHGLLCVCFNNTSFPELVEEYGLKMYLAHDRDLESLKATLLNAVNDLSGIQPSLAENIEIVKKYFSLAYAKEQFNQLLV